MTWMDDEASTLLILQPEELDFSHYLKQSKVPLSQPDIFWSKVFDIQPQLEKLIEKNHFSPKVNS